LVDEIGWNRGKKIEVGLGDRKERKEGDRGGEVTLIPLLSAVVWLVTQY